MVSPVKRAIALLWDLSDRLFGNCDDRATDL